MPEKQQVPDFIYCAARVAVSLIVPQMCFMAGILGFQGLESSVPALHLCDTLLSRTV